MKTIKTLVIEEDGRLVMKEMIADYEGLSEELEGLIEPIYELEDKGIIIWGNEESKLMHKEAQCWIYNKQDIACGKLVFLQDDEDYKPLTNNQIEYVKAWWKKNRLDTVQRIVYTNAIANMF